MNKLIKKAFTLIELLVVIAIIGILSGLIVVLMSGVTQKANIAKSQVFSNSLKNSLMSNLTGEWNFDGPTTINETATSSDVLDFWGNHAGTVIGVPTVKGGSDCISGKCLSFNIAGDYISLSSLGIPMNGTATISGWFYLRDSAKNRGVSMHLFGNFLYQHLANDYIYILGDGADYFKWIPSLNSWYYLAVTYSGDASTSVLYINGVPKNCTLQGGGYVPAFTNRVSNAGTTFLNGLVDEVKVYSAKIPTSQIKQNYYLGLNNLLANGNITKEEYLSRLNDYAVK